MQRVNAAFDHTHTPVGLLWASHRPVAKASTRTTFKKKQARQTSMSQRDFLILIVGYKSLTIAAVNLGKTATSNLTHISNFVVVKRKPNQKTRFSVR
jgi:hypothetical protein